MLITNALIFLSSHWPPVLPIRSFFKRDDPLTLSLGLLDVTKNPWVAYLKLATVM